jgi:hypothetical protein
MLGGYLYVGILFILPFTLGIALFNINPNDYTGYQIYLYVIMAVGVVAFVDFLTLGLLKRIKLLEKVYYPIAKIIAILTLARLYRPIYYGLVSNTRKIYLFLLLLAFSALTIYGVRGMMNTHHPGDNFSQLELWETSWDNYYYQGYYQDENQDDYSLMAQIPSKMIDQKVIPLFIPAHIRLEEKIIEFSNLDSLKNIEETSNANLIAFKHFYHIYLDDQLVNELDWKYYYHSKTNQRGYLTFLNLSTIESGTHSLKIAGPPELYSGSFAIIPFYYLGDGT